MIRANTSFALCNSKLEPVLVFSDFESMVGHVKRQKELHGTLPSSTPCKVTTIIETEKVEWPPELE